MDSVIPIRMPITGQYAGIIWKSLSSRSACPIALPKESQTHWDPASPTTGTSHHPDRDPSRFRPRLWMQPQVDRGHAVSSVTRFGLRGRNSVLDSNLQSRNYVSMCTTRSAREKCYHVRPNRNVRAHAECARSCVQAWLYKHSARPDPAFRPYTVAIRSRRGPADASHTAARSRGSCAR